LEAHRYLRGRKASHADYTDRLRLLALNDASFADTSTGQQGLDPEVLDSKSLAPVRLAALTAVGGSTRKNAGAADLGLSGSATMPHGHADRTTYSE
jgi:hypothetical protein